MFFKSTDLRTNAIDIFETIEGALQEWKAIDHTIEDHSNSFLNVTTCSLFMFVEYLNI